MNRHKNSNSRPVYSTESGRLCPSCRQPVANCKCKEKASQHPPGDGVVRLQRETKGRGGKAVTIITGVALPAEELKALAKALKQKCGVGGALKQGNIEIQGDQREILASELKKRGFSVKISGG